MSIGRGGPLSCTTTLGYPGNEPKTALGPLCWNSARTPIAAVLLEQSSAAGVDGEITPLATAGSGSCAADAPHDPQAHRTAHSTKQRTARDGIRAAGG